MVKGINVVAYRQCGFSGHIIWVQWVELAHIQHMFIRAMAEMVHIIWHPMADARHFRNQHLFRDHQFHVEALEVLDTQQVHSFNKKVH